MFFTKAFCNFSNGQTLTVIILSTSSFCVLLAGMVLVTYDYVSSRARLVRDVLGAAAFNSRIYGARAKSPAAKAIAVDAKPVGGEFPIVRQTPLREVAFL